MTHTVVVLAKEPRPRCVKTRLVPPLTYEQAAVLAGEALRDTLAAVAEVDVPDRVLAFDGNPRRWLPRGWRHIRQPSGALDARIIAALAAGRGPTILVGMDTPQLCAVDLGAFDPSRFDACLGPAADGGFWAIGFADPRFAGRAIDRVPMSTKSTGAIQLSRLTRLGLRVQMLETMTDFDTIDSAHEVARQAPHTRFAAALAATPALT
jgi:glycosyltransferase A (GT-A) superfamily protein (DUF2064 family)